MEAISMQQHLPVATPFWFKSHAKWPPEMSVAKLTAVYLGWETVLRPLWNKDKLWQMKHDNKSLNGATTEGEQESFCGCQDWTVWGIYFCFLAIRTKPIFQFPSEQSLVVCAVFAYFGFLGFPHFHFYFHFSWLVIGANKSAARTSREILIGFGFSSV